MKTGHTHLPHPASRIPHQAFIRNPTDSRVRARTPHLHPLVHLLVHPYRQSSRQSCLHSSVFGLPAVALAKAGLQSSVSSLRSLSSRIPLLAALAALCFFFVLLPVQAEEVALDKFLARYGFSKPEMSADIFKTESLFTSLLFEKDSRRLTINNILIWLHEAPQVTKEQWKLNRTDIEKTLAPILRPPDIELPRPASLVVLDPGHGGQDQGAVSPGNIEEKRAVLDIAKRTQKILENSGITAKLTRRKDVDLSLAARTAKAKEWQADVFVSIHLNSAANPNANGVETFLLPAAGKASTAGNARDTEKAEGNKFDGANMLLAFYTQTALVRHAGFYDRGVKRARYTVLKDAPCPAILVECGFLSNAADEARLAKVAERQKIAEAIAQGIMTYISRTAWRSGEAISLSD